MVVPFLGGNNGIIPKNMPSIRNNVIQIRTVGWRVCIYIECHKSSKDMGQGEHVSFTAHCQNVGIVFTV